MEKLNLLPSLNYTDLTTILMTCGILLVAIIGSLIYALARAENKIKESNDYQLRRVQDLEDYTKAKFAQRFEDLEKINQRSVQHNGLILIHQSEIERIKKSLLKPKFKVGDKVSTTSIKSGTIIEIVLNNDFRFDYLIQPRSYFGRPVKNEWHSDFTILS